MLLPQILYLATGQTENLFLRYFCFRTSVIDVIAIECKGKGTKYRIKRNETIEDNPKMKTFDEMLAKQMKDEEFKKEYEAIQPEMDVIRARVNARTSQEQ